MAEESRRLCVTQPRAVGMADMNGPPSTAEVGLHSLTPSPELAELHAH